MYCKFSMIMAFLIFSNLFQLSSNAQQTISTPNSRPCLPYEFMENLPKRCSLLFEQWAKTHPAAANELKRRQSMDEDWVKEYPKANAKIHDNLANIKNWVVTHPDIETEIQKFRAECINSLR